MIPEKGGVGGLAVEQNDNTDEGLAVHALVDVETGLIDGANVIYHSVSPITNSGPIEFIVPRDNECSFILNQTRLSGYFVVEDEDGNAVLPNDPVSLVNHFSACLFSQVEVYLNGTQVCDLSSANSYPWRMFIQSYLTYSKAVKDSYLAAEGYYSENPDEADNLDYDTISKQSTPGMFARRALMTRKKPVFFNTRLGVDLFYTDRFLPPNIDIKIKLIRNKETFGLRYLSRRVDFVDDGEDQTDAGPTPAGANNDTTTSSGTATGSAAPAESNSQQNQTARARIITKNYRIVLKDLKLHMRKVLPTLQIRDNYKARLLKSPCYLPYKASKLRHFTIPAGISSYTIPNVATGILPKSVVFAMIHSEAMNFNPQYNPFNFEHFNLNRFNITRNGQNVFPKAIETNFKNGDVLDLYRHMYDSLGVKHGNHSFGTTIEEFKRGKTFMVADLNPDQCNLYHTHADVYGNLDLELSFAKNLEVPIYIFAYMNYNSGIKIDQYHQVFKGSE